MERSAVLAFRANGHHLATKLPRKDLPTAVGAIGIRDIKGSALVALHARVEAVTQQEFDEAIRRHAIVEVISARGAQALVPADDVAVFTLGTLPADDASLRVRLKPFLPVLDRAGHTASDALDRCIEVARQALAAGPVDIGVLSGALTRGLPELSPMCRGRCGVAHIEQGLFDMVGESAVWRTERVDGHKVFVAMDISGSREDARAELVRRYLRCYGPTTAAHFAEWCGIGTKDAARSLDAAEAGAVEVDASPKVSGVRLLPPRDPYLLDRDRQTLIPDRDIQKRVWRAVPVDGIVLADGEPVATWRPSKKGDRLTLNVEPFAPLTKAVRAALEEEAANVATLRNCATVEVAVARGDVSRRAVRRGARSPRGRRSPSRWPRTRRGPRSCRRVTWPSSACARHRGRRRPSVRARPRRARPRT